MWPQSGQLWVWEQKLLLPFLGTLLELHIPLHRRRAGPWYTDNHQPRHKLPSALHHCNYLKQGLQIKTLGLPSTSFQYIPPVTINTRDHKPNMASDFSSNNTWFRVSKLLFDNTGRFCSVWSIRDIWAAHSPHSEGRFPMLVSFSWPVIWKGWRFL